MPFVSNTTTPLDRPMDTTRRSGVSKIFKQSVPSFIIDEYPLFLDFLEAYYEWLDQHGNPIEVLQNGHRNFDIDTTADKFLEHFKSNFLYGFPKRLASAEGRTLNERTLIKNIREFYKIKGSEKSINLLFKLIAASDSTIEYPRDYIFVLSSANYKDYHQMYVLKDYTNLTNGFDLTQLYGLQALQYEGITELIGSATIESAYEIAYNGKEYYVLILTNPSGEFIQSDFSPIQITQGLTLHNFYPVPSVFDLSITNGGSAYSVGDFFTIGSGNSGDEIIKGFVSQTDSEGKIQKVRLFSSPVNYTGDDTLTITSSLGTGAQMGVVNTLLSKPIQEYRDNKNLLSKVSKIQDSFEYQNFSYVVNSKRSLEEYIDAIKTIVHPSGFVIFNSLYNNIYSLRPSQYTTRVVQFENAKIGSYAKYNRGFQTGSGDTAGWNPYIGGGDPNATKRWGNVFSYWLGDTEVNPSEGDNSIPSGLTGYYGGTAVYGDFAPGLTFLPNSSQNQVEGITHWIVMPHPSIRSMDSVPYGTSFGYIKLGDMLKLPVPIIGDA
jgi:hypothetical protein